MQKERCDEGFDKFSVAFSIMHVVKYFKTKIFPCFTFRKHY
jgi:hypothetical protein